jgi:hypothetical protein
MDEEKYEDPGHDECHYEENVKYFGYSFASKQSFEGLDDLSTTALKTAENASCGQ